jgi:hypothetical protein
VVFQRSRRVGLALATVGAAAASTLAALPAAAADPYVALIPYVAPRVDVAQGAAFATVARDSSGISYAETWQLQPGSGGYVVLRNRHWKDGQYPVCLDIQDTSVPGSPSNPGHGSPVGTSRCDGSSSQQWKIVTDSLSGASTLTNKHSDLKLTYRGTGYDPAYTQTASGLGDRRFVVQYLG